MKVLVRLTKFILRSFPHSTFHPLFINSSNPLSVACTLDITKLLFPHKNLKHKLSLYIGAQNRKMASIHPRYIPSDPREGSDSTIASSIRVLRPSDNTFFLASIIPDVCTKDIPVPIRSRQPTPEPIDQVPATTPISPFHPDPHAKRPSQTSNYEMHTDLDSSSNGTDDDDENPTYTTKLAPVILPTAGKSLSLILNHPNIISLIDIIQPSLLPGSHTILNNKKPAPTADLTIFEDMNAGSLAYLLPSANSYPDPSDTHSWHVLATPNPARFSLPESLCWHVLRSISKALLWLHYGVKETAGIPGEYMKYDDDWHPILVMDISPGQIWFKRPEGGETYGECKLGGFQWARVIGTVGGEVAVASRVEGAQMVKKWFWAPVCLPFLPLPPTSHSNKRYTNTPQRKSTPTSHPGRAPLKPSPLAPQSTQ